LDPASAEVIAKRETKVRTKIIESNFFTIANPSFRSNLSSFTFLDGEGRGFIQMERIGILGVEDRRLRSVP
jgi:hypothetical protein